MQGKFPRSRGATWVPSSPWIGFVTGWV